MNLPPLSLYVHVPWCVQKCPYCDFNSHGQKGEIPEAEYVQHLIDDLKADLHLVQGRKIHSIFIGGGTPSLLTGAAYTRLLNEVDNLIGLEEHCEITLEANPGTVETGRFKDYVKAGINRISIGVQSMQNDKLKALGRIHGSDEANYAAQQAKEAGLNSFNLDLMHGLPGQTLDDALSDLKQIIALDPPHISWYQLTIEPNTQFASKPPTLPQDETLWDIQEQGVELLAQAGYIQYEISGYAKPGYQCQHNLNYWRFGDYLGIGCGAHGKVTDANTGLITRTEKVKHPRGYMDLIKPYMYKSWHVEQDDLAFEFFMNRFRLVEPCPINDFNKLTTLPLQSQQSALNQAINKGLLTQTDSHWQVSLKGHRFLNDLLELFV
ncbi:radical SAM family heme chaperone HemW [Pseudoalteromonas sp. NZS127_1]|uniref:radical SAM family heme chaperone HemW n=1 Tax=unclassified Pseudoalteromonas TaxID=194690 RepID=UPI0003F73666|nr:MULTISPECIES: radical SAM family heme chaperone HemW [unclassified Pseudoalteromonas]MBG9994989.1 radical SAM family heme chaperone HemW [Pseudoalteromonas sp. NZS127_1]MBG9998787.1 radical SAM family heme chaperone HemW [Pseudoalteromonas sp. NSLLW24]MBH0012173.1 radical SAM family heme chaperone HemW [Pseudoalteromonas sp. NZS100_1]MBH0043621.1 radical SAM family heme chaperone HemW [Pseudoalteromonas sp. SWXJZ10B]MBH0062628.1 radical SAM family heme chaperone HemW [Pseudoalteromonas sp. 